jgi:tetratricopeptide (TPR) repeat protein
VHALVRPVCEQEFPDNTLTLRYAFVHALYQNSLYGALSPARRTRTSAAVAEVLVGLYGEQTATIAAELALLYEAARDFGPASDHFALAARNAAAIYANQEAVELTRKAIANAERLQGRQRHERVFSAALQLGRLHMTLSRFEDALADFGQAEKAARDCGDPENEVSAICGSARALYYLERLGEMAEQGRRALELARTSRSEVCVASAELVLGQERLCVGALPEAAEYFDRAVPVMKSQDFGRVKGSLYGRAFWSRGYCVSTVGLDEAMIKEYIQDQEKHERDEERGLFDID